MKPKCVVCGKPITWAFYVCSDCEEQYGKRKDERPEWLTFLINEERMARYRHENGKNAIPIEEAENVSYAIDFELLISYRLYYAGWMIEDTDGGELFAIQDSDWEALYS